MSPAVASTKKKILIVEDDKYLAKALALKFKTSGFDPTPCYGGQEAIDCLNKDTYDIVLLDILMPGKDGFSVLTEKKGTPNATTPVHVLTALGQEDILDRAKELGARECYVKSKVPISDVVENVKREVGLS